MSKKKALLEISVPHFLLPLDKSSSQIVDMKSQEEIVSHDHECSYCNGSGGFWVELPAVGNVRKVCPLCKGSGKLDAVITIEWKPKHQ